ncbi:hypothetical protein C8R46DRAFT_1040126 [Mycena filopes]|nr:hypothetical protein C8R46DRAFT_1040126 [Mycena filopes]
MSAETNLTDDEEDELGFDDCVVPSFSARGRRVAQRQAAVVSHPSLTSPDIDVQVPPRTSLSGITRLGSPIVISSDEEPEYGPPNIIEVSSGEEPDVLFRDSCRFAFPGERTTRPAKKKKRLRTGNAPYRKIVPLRRLGSPVLVSSGEDEPVQGPANIVDVSSGDDGEAAARNAWVFMLPSGPLTPPKKIKRKTRQQRDADAVKNTVPIDDLFHSPMGTSKRVPLTRRRLGPVRTVPLVDSPSRMVPYSPRVHRPPVVIHGPPRVRRPLAPTCYTAGWRQPRPPSNPLEVIHLWRDGSATGPPAVTVREKHHECAICKELKSHPVTVSLETKWECPICREVMTAAPFRARGEEDLLRDMYGEWDTTVVDYSWDGPVMPVPQNAFDVASWNRKLEDMRPQFPGFKSGVLFVVSGGDPMRVKVPFRYGVDVNTARLRDLWVHAWVPNHTPNGGVNLADGAIVLDGYGDVRLHHSYAVFYVPQALDLAVKPNTSNIFVHGGFTWAENVLVIRHVHGVPRNIGARHLSEVHLVLQCRALWSCGVVDFISYIVPIFNGSWIYLCVFVIADPSLTAVNGSRTDLSTRGISRQLQATTVCFNRLDLIVGWPMEYFGPSMQRCATRTLSLAMSGPLNSSIVQPAVIAAARPSPRAVADAQYWAWVNSGIPAVGIFLLPEVMENILWDFTLADMMRLAAASVPTRYVVKSVYKLRADRIVELNFFAAPPLSAAAVLLMNAFWSLMHRTGSAIHGSSPSYVIRLESATRRWLTGDLNIAIPVGTRVRWHAFMVSFAGNPALVHIPVRTGTSHVVRSAFEYTIGSRRIRFLEGVGPSVYDVVLGTMGSTSDARLITAEEVRVYYPRLAVEWRSLDSFNSPTVDVCYKLERRGDSRSINTESWSDGTRKHPGYTDSQYSWSLGDRCYNSLTPTCLARHDRRRARTAPDSRPEYSLARVPAGHVERGRALKKMTKPPIYCDPVIACLERMNWASLYEVATNGNRFATENVRTFVSAKVDAPLADERAGPQNAMAAGPDIISYLVAHHRARFWDILSQMNISDQVSLSRTSKANQHLCQVFLQLEVSDILAKFGLAYSDVKLAQATTGMVISGSSVTSIAHQRSQPNDLDLYVHHRHGYRLIEWLRIVGDVHSVQLSMSEYVDARGLRGVWRVHAVNGNCVINIMQTTSEDPRACILDTFHSAPSRGCIEFARFCHYESNQIDRSVALVTPHSLKIAEDLEDLQCVWAIIDKYRNRGFTFAFEYDQPHVCGQDLNCPVTQRNTADAGCAYARLPAVDIPYSEPYHTRPISWSLHGSYPCAAGFAGALIGTHPASTVQNLLFRGFVKALLRLENEPEDDEDVYDMAAEVMRVVEQQLSRAEGDRSRAVRHNDGVIISPVLRPVQGAEGVYKTHFDMTRDKTRKWADGSRPPVLLHEYSAKDTHEPPRGRRGWGELSGRARGLPVYVARVFGRVNAVTAVLDEDNGLAGWLLRLECPEPAAADTALLFHAQVSALRRVVETDRESIPGPVARNYCGCADDAHAPSAHCEIEIWIRGVCPSHDVCTWGRVPLGTNFQCEVSLTRYQSDEDDNGNVIKLVFLYSMAAISSLLKRSALSSESDDHIDILARAAFGVDYAPTRNRSVVDDVGPAHRYTYKTTRIRPPLFAITEVTTSLPPYTPHIIGQVEEREPTYMYNPVAAEGFGRTGLRMMLHCPAGATASTVQFYLDQVKQLNAVRDKCVQDLGGKVVQDWVHPGNPEMADNSRHPWIVVHHANSKFGMREEMAEGAVLDLAVQMSVDLRLVGEAYEHRFNVFQTFTLWFRTYQALRIADIPIANWRSGVVIRCAFTFVVSFFSMATIADLLTEGSDHLGIRILGLDWYMTDYFMTRDNSLLLDERIIHRYSCKDPFKHTRMISECEGMPTYRKLDTPRYEPWVVGQVQCTRAEIEYRRVDCFTVQLRCPDTANAKSREFFAHQVAALQGVLDEDVPVNTLVATFCCVELDRTRRERTQIVADANEFLIWNAGRWAFQNDQHMKFQLELTRDDNLDDKKHVFTAWIRDYAVLTDEELEEDEDLTSGG